MASTVAMSGERIEVVPDGQAGSAVSWGAVIGGAVVAAAISLALLALGTGLGFSSVSPWGGAGMSAAGIGIAAALWLWFVQGASSALGGYIAGRLRTRWTDVNLHEVYFRDTAHGFLAWAVASLLSASILASAAGLLVGGAATTAAKLGGGALTAATVAGPSTAEDAGPEAYFSDMLLRSNKPGAAPADESTRGEIGRILLRSLANGGISTDDKNYLSTVVAERSGVSQQEAQQRVDQVIAQARQAADRAAAKARQAADTARKAGAYLSLWLFIAFLSGAFLASFAANLGGRARDGAVLSRR